MLFNTKEALQISSRYTLKNVLYIIIGLGGHCHSFHYCLLVVGRAASLDAGVNRLFVETSFRTIRKRRACNRYASSCV